MKAVGYSKAGSIEEPNALIDVDLPDPDPGSQDLLVRVHAVSVNPVDTKVRRAASPPAGEFKVLGWDACGIVEQVGDAVSGFAVGDRVWYAGQIDRQGCNSELHAVDFRIVSRAPESWTDAQSAALPLTSLTAWEALFEHLRYSSEACDANRSTRLLIINGAGGVGSVALQLCRWAGIPATATASRQPSRAWCLEHGAAEVVGHGELASMPDASFDRILCCHDTDAYFDEMARLVAPQGLICALSGAKKPHDLLPLMSKSAGFIWEYMFTRSKYQTPDMAEQGRILATIASLAESGEIRTTLTETRHGLSADNLLDMHRKQESGVLIGKQVVTMTVHVKAGDSTACRSP